MGYELQIPGDLPRQVLALEDFDLGLVVLALDQSLAVDLLDRDDLRLALLDQDGGAAPVLRPHCRYDEHRQNRDEDRQAQNAPSTLGDRTPIFEQVEGFVLRLNRYRGFDRLKPLLKGQVVHQKKLSSMVRMSPGKIAAFRSTRRGVCLGSSSRMMLIFSREARSLKPPAMVIALRTVKPGENG